MAYCLWNGRQVSLRESDSNGSLDPTVGSSILASLTNISSSYFNVEVPSALRLNSAGGVFAIAEVWPSRKVPILDHIHFGNVHVLAYLHENPNLVNMPGPTGIEVVLKTTLGIY